MKKLFFFTILMSLMLATSGFLTANPGDRCAGDASCGFGEKCQSGVCIKKNQFDFGGSGKNGKPCNIDADCIGSGKCVSNGFGKKFCSGN